MTPESSQFGGRVPVQPFSTSSPPGGYSLGQPSGPRFGGPRDSRGIGALPTLVLSGSDPLSCDTNTLSQSSPSSDLRAVWGRSGPTVVLTNTPTVRRSTAKTFFIEGPNRERPAGRTVRCPPPPTAHTRRQIVGSCRDDTETSVRPCPFPPPSLLRSFYKSDFYKTRSSSRKKEKKGMRTTFWFQNNFVVVL